MKPHFFGDGLYGVYHEPRVDVASPTTVLACYPIAGEYMRAHRAFRQLTNLLTRSGAHVMRFDYVGTGDSAGDPDLGSVTRWRRDIGAALEELGELTGAATFKVVGLRYGATLAALAADDYAAIEQVVMWDPVVDGAAYVRELESKHAAEQAARGAAVSLAGTIGVNGFALPKQLRDEIGAVDLRRWTPNRAVRADVVVSSEQAAWSDLARHFKAVPVRGEYVVSPSAGDWGEADEFGSALIPQQIIQSVVGCLTERNG